MKEERKEEEKEKEREDGRFMNKKNIFFSSISQD